MGLGLQLFFSRSSVEMSIQPSYDQLPEHILEQIFGNVRDKRDQLNLFLVSLNWNCVARRTITFDKTVYIHDKKELPHVPDRKFKNITILCKFDPIFVEFLMSRRMDIETLLMPTGNALCRVLEITAKFPRLWHLALGDLWRPAEPSWYKTLLTKYVDFIPTTALRAQRFNQLDMLVKDFPVNWLFSEFVVILYLDHSHGPRQFHNFKFRFPNLCDLELGNATIDDAQQLADAYPRLRHLKFKKCRVEFTDWCAFSNLTCIHILDSVFKGARFISTPKLDTMEIGFFSTSIVPEESIFNLAIKRADKLKIIDLKMYPMHDSLWEKLFRVVAACGAVMDLGLSSENAPELERLAGMQCMIENLKINKM